jgi:hypothetical protein
VQVQVHQDTSPGDYPVTLTATIGSDRHTGQGIVRVVRPGTLRMAVSRAATGRRKAGACVAPTRSLIRNGARRCTRFVAVTTVTKAGLGAGPRTIAFSGRGRVAGAYRLSLTLRAGGKLSPPAVVTVTVKP